MKLARKILTLALLLAASRPNAARSDEPPPSPEAAKTLARDIYYYAYPLVLMDTTMRQATNVPNATSIPMRAPANQFAHFREYPKADAKEVVRFNFDTLYSAAWLDLGKGPVVLSVPDAGGRYYLVPLLDMWSDVFAVPGTRTTGGKAGHFAITPPGWQGVLPEGVAEIRAPTPSVWVLGRTQTNGPADYPAVHKVQDGYRLTPLDRWGRGDAPPPESPVDPGVDGKTPPVEQVDKLDGVAMLGRLAALLKVHPPHANDYPILSRMRALGLEPGEDFDLFQLDPATAEAVNAGAREALEDMTRSVKSMGTRANGWSILTDNTGTYGTSYRHRAIVALAGLGANLPADAVYPTAFVDVEDKPLDSANAYVLHFGASELPPADAFWSLTLYDDRSFQVANAINRFAIGDRDKLAFNADGSLDISIQSASPGEGKESNWLPAPASGPFNITLRIYSPRREVLDGTWVPPGIRRAR
jgi:hypothetical protein